MTHYKYIGETRGELANFRTLVRNRVTHKTFAVEADVNRVARQCGTFSTLEEHAERLAPTTSQQYSHSEHLEILHNAADLGLLISYDVYKEQLRAGLCDTGTAPAIDKIAIPTRNRTEALQRLLRQLTDHLEVHQRYAGILVVDDSEDSAICGENRRIVAQAVRQGAHIQYEDRMSRTDFAKKLAALSGVPYDLVHFALLGEPQLPVTIGSARNTALLQTAGHKLLFMDDDVECVLIAPEDIHSGIEFGAENTDISFYSDSTKLSGLTGTGESLLDLHDRALELHAIGRSDNEIRTSKTPVSLLRRIRNGNGRVLAGLMGIAGDSGYDDPFSYYLQNSETWRRFTESETIYRAALENRLILRTSAGFCVSDRSTCQSHCISLRNDGLLPPFLPSLRGEDLVFGTLLLACIPGSLVGIIPRAIKHTPLTPRTYAPESAINRIGNITAGEAAAFLIGSIQLRGTEADELFTCVGDGLMQLSRMQSTEFRAQIFTAAEPMLYAWYQQLHARSEDRLYRNSSGRRDAINLRDKLERLLQTKDICTPCDLSSSFGSEKSLSILQENLGRLGQLLRVWPLLWQAAEHLSAG